MYFQGAKMHEVSSRDVSFVFDLDLWLLTLAANLVFRMTFELWPWIKIITFSGSHKGENMFIRSYVTLKHGFHDSAKFAFSSRQNAENVFARSYVALNVSFKTRQ